MNTKDFLKSLSKGEVAKGINLRREELSTLLRIDGFDDKRKEAIIDYVSHVLEEYKSSYDKEEN